MASEDPIEKAHRLAAEGRLAEAVAILRARVMAEPGDTAALRALGAMLGRSGDLPGARAAYRRAARFLSSGGKLLAALAVLREAQALQDDDDIRSALADLVARLRAGEIASAAPSPADPVDALVEKLVADAVAEAGQGARELAAGRLRTVLALRPGHPRAAALMRTLGHRRG